jgi:hypothetical protein
MGCDLNPTIHDTKDLASLIWESGELLFLC